jgi:hypothetical protein
MAILRNIQKALNGPHWTQVTVGHNRTIENMGGNLYSCRLHGHIIAKVQCGASDKATVTLDTCGYRGPTTRDAMGDFLIAFGIQGNVSFAKGGFSLWLYDRKFLDIDSSGKETMTFDCTRDLKVEPA